MNEQFLYILFGEDAPYVHVTDFTEDPLGISQERRGICWGGDYAKNYRFLPGQTNQYYTISIFSPDASGRARRIRELFLRTRVIVLDDVKEKLDIEEVKKLPEPTYILETSQGSEQWGYALNIPCTSREMVDNLLDGLVANGLAPDSIDPGMKGVTRYVRLPDGYNTKASKQVNGQPFKCRLTRWEPFVTVSIERLAEPFNVDLYAPRNDLVTSGAAEVDDHPLLTSGIVIKRSISPGRYDVQCPWIGEHTNRVDDGAAVFTNEDGSIGFQCHHGNCQDRTASDLLTVLDAWTPGFTKAMDDWKMKKQLSKIVGADSDIPFEIKDDSVKDKPNKDYNILDKTLEHLTKLNPQKEIAREHVAMFLKAVDGLDEIDKLHYHTEVCDFMGWSKSDFVKILRDLRLKWYEKHVSDFYKDFIFVNELNKFYDRRSGIFMTPDAFQNSLGHEDSEVKKQALLKGKVTKVDKMDFAPKQPEIFVRDRVTYANTWSQKNERLGTEGDVSLWLNHFDVLGWTKHRDHILKWMAYTILKPEHKINHILVLGGNEGVGKDMLLSPFMAAMGVYHRIVDGSVLASDFNSYLMNTKYLHINETELGDHKESTKIRNKIKPLAAAPPATLSVNMKNITPIDITNIVNVTMTTNSHLPFKLDGVSRRYYAVWSDLSVRDSNNQVKPEWDKYFTSIWQWFNSGGTDYCIYYLRNHVDISDFDPFSPPPVTEFLQSIQESSKSPGQQTVEAFIQNEVLIFKNDLITASDACDSIKNGAMTAHQFMYIDSSWFSPTKCGYILNDIPGVIKYRARGAQDLRVYAIRNQEKYEGLSLSDMYDAYEAQKRF